jgi:hypothetical protein
MMSDHSDEDVDVGDLKELKVDVVGMVYGSNVLSSTFR